MDDRTRPVRILIADDHPIFRHGLRTLLEGEPGFSVIGEASDGSEVVKLGQKLKPDILLLDLAMPHLDGLEALRELMHSSVPLRTIMLTAAIERPQIFEALMLGARGVLLKDAAAQLIIKSIHTVLNGQFWVGRESVSDLVQYLREISDSSTEKSGKKSFGLSPREREIVSAIVAGYTNKDIATKFSLSEDTVKHHLTHIFDKTGVSNRLELAVFAIHHRLVDTC